MKHFLRQTDEVIKWNLRQLVVFVILYRLAAGIFYIRAVNGLLRFSLSMAGYSYLTLGNLGAFLWHPFTLPCVALALMGGMVLVTVETAGLVTAFQASAYSRKMDLLGILGGAAVNTWDQIRRRNWQIFVASLGNYILMNSYLLARLLTKVKPVDFVLEEVLNLPAARLGLVILMTVLSAAAVPSMLVFWACMVEQKRFRDGLRRSMELLKGRWIKAVGALVCVNVLLMGGLVLLYGAAMALAAVLVTLFADSYAALAVLTAVCGKTEIILLFAGAVFAVILDFGALTVLYYRFSQSRREQEDSAKRYPVRRRTEAFMRIVPGRREIMRRWLLLFSGVLAGTAAFLIFDMAYNGMSSDWSVLGQTEITAHRGSSKMAPENTMAAIFKAMDEMADYCEIDVQTTADDVVVVCHDRNLKRVAGVDRLLTDMTFEQARSLDVGSYFGEEYAGEKIPSLREVLEACKGRIRLNIELKSLGEKSSLPELTAGLIKEYGMKDQCVVTSVSLEYLKRVKAADPDIRTGYILAAGYGSYYKNEFIDFISIRSSFVTRKMVEAAHENGKGVHVWTVDDRGEMKQMRLLGVDNIITDYPARAREVLYGDPGAKNLLEFLKMGLKHG